MAHRSMFDAWSDVSLRTKITGVTVLVLTFGLLLSGVGTMLLFKPVLLLQLDQQLEAAATTTSINALLQSQTSGTVADDGASGDYFYAFYADDGSLQLHNWRHDAASERPAIPASMSLAQGAKCAAKGPFTLTNPAGTEQFRVLCAPVTVVSSSQQMTALVAVSTKQISSVLASYLTIFLGFSIIVIVVGAFLTRMLVTTTFAPLRQVERTAAAIADGDFSQRLGGAEPNTEVGRLSRSLNTMLGRIDNAFKDRARTIDQMRRFVGDASHELRTPLVTVRGYAELYRMGALPNPEDVGQAMERIEKEAVRMAGLVEDLLELARLDETKPLQLAIVDLVPLASDAVMDAGARNPGRSFRVVVDGARMPRTAFASAATPDALTKPAGVTTATGPIAFAGSALARLRRNRSRRADTGPVAPVVVPPPALPQPGEAPRVPALVRGEENKLRQVLNNLIANAVRYTPAGTPIEVHVTTDTELRTASFEVIDHGDGIPPQIREKIFQRFWRADTSRTRDTGGSGLGLAIVASIVNAHRGSVSVLDTAGGGATFRVTLPLADDPTPQHEHDELSAADAADSPAEPASEPETR